MKALSLKSLFKPGSKWSRINHRFPQKASLPDPAYVEGSGITEFKVIAAIGQPVNLTVESSSKIEVAFVFTDYPDAPMSYLPAPADSIKMEATRDGVIEVRDNRGTLLTYNPVK